MGRSLNNDALNYGCYNDKDDDCGGGELELAT